MHFSFNDTRVAKGVELRNWQSIHVSAQTHSPVALSAPDDSDDARLSQATVDGNTPLGEQLRNEIGRALFLKAKLRMGVDITSHSGEGVCLRNNGLDQRRGQGHGSSIIPGIMGPSAGRVT
jgi:hypothetical protein